MSESKHLVMAMIVYCCIDLSRGYGAMSKKMLDIADIHPLFEEQGGHGVPEHVGGEVETQAGLVGVAP